MKKVYGMTGIVAAAVLAVSCLLPSVPVSAEETGTQALAEADGSGMVQQGMVPVSYTHLCVLRTKMVRQ